MSANTVEELLDLVKPNEHPLIRQWRLAVMDENRHFINGVLRNGMSHELQPETVFLTIWDALPHSWKAFCVWTVAGLSPEITPEGVVRDWYTDRTCPFPMDLEKQ